MKKIFITCLMTLLLLVQSSYSIYAESESSHQSLIYLPILMYHQISDDPSKLSEYVISPEEFESDLKLIQQRGYTTITINDLLEHTAGLKSLPPKPIMLTFDDGFESDYVYAFPLLKKHKTKAVFSIIGKYADLYSGDNVHKHISYSHLSWDQIKEMHDSGYAEFHNHTYDMHDINKRRGALQRKRESFEEYEAALIKDLGRVNEGLFTHIGASALAFTCPYGYYNDNLRQAVKDSGYRVILTSNQKINTLTGNPDELYRLNRFVRPHRMNITRLFDSWDAYSATGQK